MTTTLILDTSVLVAALVTRNPRQDGPPSRLVEAVLAGRTPFVVSDELLSEYGRVMARPRIVARFNRDEARVALVLARLSGTGILVECRAPRVEPPDPKDRHLWALLEARSDAVLVTSEYRLAIADHFPGRVLLPASALDRFGLR